MCLLTPLKQMHPKLSECQKSYQAESCQGLDGVSGLTSPVWAPQPCLQPRTPLLPLSPARPCPRDAAAGMVSSSHSPALPSHGFGQALSPGKCGCWGWGCPRCPICPAPSPGAVGWARLPGPALFPQGIPVPTVP